MPTFIDHVVLIVSDLEESVSFYSGFLGEPLEIGDDHGSFRAGETRLFLALPSGEWEARDKDRGGMNHLAFGVRTLEELADRQEALDTAGIQNSGVMTDPYGGREFVWFDDPDGTRLEFYLRPAEDQ